MSGRTAGDGSGSDVGESVALTERREGRAGLVQRPRMEPTSGPILDPTGILKCWNSSVVALNQTVVEVLKQMGSDANLSAGRR